jgi:hypothetical protein
MHNTLSRLAKYLPDKAYLYVLFFRHHHRLLNLNNPDKFNDQIQWIKLNGRLERFSRYADKYAVREYVESKIGKDYLVPLYGVWDSFDEIDFDSLPQQFVLKATHGCGYNYICHDKGELDPSAIKQAFDNWMNENFYLNEREPQYRDCQPRIVAEKYLEDRNGQLTDYKFYCSKGNVTDIQVNVDRFSTNMIDQHMNVNWEQIKTVENKLFSMADQAVKKPRQFKKMLSLAQKLSEDFPFVRVDLYYANDKIYFGELTFTPGSGLIKFDRRSNSDQELARLLKIDLAAYKG